MKKSLPPEVVAPILASLKKAIADNEALAKNIGDKEIEKCGDMSPGKDMSKNASMGYPAAGTPPAGMGAGVVKEEPKAEMDPATGDSCPKCGEKGIHAGQMGSQEHYLCKGCGQNYSHPAMNKSDWAPHAGKKIKAPGSGGLKKDAFPQVIKPNPFRSASAVRGAPGETTKVPNAKDQAAIQARSKLGKTEMKKAAFGPSDKAHSASLMANVLGTTASHQKAADLHWKAADHAQNTGNHAAAKIHSQAMQAHLKYASKGAAPKPEATPMAKAQPKLPLPGMTPPVGAAPKKPSFLGGLLERNGHGPTSVGQANKELGSFQSLASNPTAMPGNVVAKAEPKNKTFAVTYNHKIAGQPRLGVHYKEHSVEAKDHDSAYAATKSKIDSLVQGKVTVTPYKKNGSKDHTNSKSFDHDVTKSDLPTATGDAMPQTPSKETIGNKSAGVASPAAETKPKADK